MSHNPESHWPTLPSTEGLTEQQAESRIEEIRKRAHAIQLEKEAEGRYQCASDSWLAAEAEVFKLNTSKPAK